MRPCERRNHADRRLHVLLALPWLRRSRKTQGRRLLRVLQLRFRGLPACAVAAGLLRSVSNYAAGSTNLRKKRLPTSSRLTETSKEIPHETLA